MLKYETQEVPTGLEAYYEDAGNGVFKLKVEGAVPAAQLEEQKNKVKDFRDNNTSLKARVEALERFETLFKTGDFSEEKLTAKVKEQAERMAQEMKAALEAEKQGLTEQLTSTTSKLEKIVLNNAVSQAALKHGVSETALEDVYARATTAFKVVDGELQAAEDVLDAKGNKVTLDGWMASLADKAPHLFNASRGAGAKKPGTPVAPSDKKSPVDLIAAGLAKRR